MKRTWQFTVPLHLEMLYINVWLLYEDKRNKDNINRIEQ
jgi:hypothetical protein